MIPDRLRIGVFPTLNAAGNPTAVGSYFDTLFGDTDIKPGQNQQASLLRDGTQVIVSDKKRVFPIRGNLLVSTTHVDLVSGTAYLGNDIYLAPTFCKIMNEDLTIVIFQENSGFGKVCYLARFIQGSFDNICYSHACDVDIITPSHMVRTKGKQPKIFKFGLYIIKNGVYTDIDDVLTATWITRL